MNYWIEQRCEAIRLALQIPGFPDERDLLRLVDWLGANASLHHVPGVPGGCLHIEGGHKALIVPHGLNGQPLTCLLSHELGHALLSVGMGSLLRQQAPADLRARRLARMWDLKDEALANYFVPAWFMPSRLVQLLPDDAELAFQANVSEELARQRRGQLAGAVVDLGCKLPQWSAGHDYHCVVQQSGRGRAALYVVRRGSLQPVFDFPTESKTVDNDAHQVGADLVALNRGEFERKYQDFRCGAMQARVFELSQLRQWAWGAA